MQTRSQVCLRALLAVGMMLALPCPASGSSTGLRLAANPIRRVVNLLQKMQAKIEEEGEKEESLYKKFECYCKKGAGDLEESVKSAESKVPQVQSAIEEGTAEAEQLTGDIKKAKADRAEATKSLEEAEALREKEAKENTAETAELTQNIEAMKKAIAALEKGMGSSFLQSAAAAQLRRLAVNADISSADRDLLTSFLSESSDYAPQSGEIVGILKQMLEEFEGELEKITGEEKEAEANYLELKKAKEAEVEALTKSIETKTARKGELGVELVNMKEDLDDTEKSLAADKAFLADLEEDCGTKSKEWEERQKTRAEELLAISETIKVLNDDDALDLFKKTLPGPSLLQVAVSAKEVKQRALAALARSRSGADGVRMAFIAQAIRGKKVSFEKVIAMIDAMVDVLVKEGKDDEAKKASCEEDIDTSEDKAKELSVKISDLSKAIDEHKSGLEALKEDMAKLEAEIKELDKQVAEATEQRKEESAEYKETLAANNAALQLLEFAKNRLNKFYNPKLHKTTPPPELSEEDQVYVAMGGELPTTTPGGIAGTGVELPSFVQVRAHTAVAAKDAPAPPPETWGAYKKKSEESTGVITMIDMLKADLSKEIQEMQVDEKNAQQEYEKMVADAAKMRAADTQSLADKSSAVAGLEEELLSTKKEKKATKAEAMAVDEALHNLHADCDWLLKNFGLRKEARAGEIESLQNAKAVLSGADYSLVQTRKARHHAFLQH